jgi:hypothetical protein
LHCKQNTRSSVFVKKWQKRFSGAFKSLWYLCNATINSQKLASVVMGWLVGDRVVGSSADGVGFVFHSGPSQGGSQ